MGHRDPKLPLPPTFGDISLRPAPAGLWVTPPGDTGQGARGGDNVHAEDGRTPPSPWEGANPQAGPPNGEGVGGCPVPPARSGVPVPCPCRVPTAPVSPWARIGVLGVPRGGSGGCHGNAESAGGSCTRCCGQRDSRRPLDPPRTHCPPPGPPRATRGHSEPPRVTMGHHRSPRVSPGHRQSLWATAGHFGPPPVPAVPPPAPAGHPGAPSGGPGGRSPPRGRPPGWAGGGARPRVAEAALQGGPVGRGQP